MRRRGRPRLDEQDVSVRVSVALPGKKYDAICTTALREGVSVPEVIRWLLRQQSAPEPRS